MPKSKIKDITQGAWLFLSDGLYQLLSGLGGNHDKVSQLEHKPHVRLAYSEVDGAINWDGVLETFVYRPGEDALSNGLEYPGLDISKVKMLNKTLNEYGFFECLEEAYGAMRRTGFSVIWLDTGALDNSAPMSANDIKRLRRLVVYDAECLQADPMGYRSQYSTPKVWIITDPENPYLKIDRSRLLIFPGRSVSPRQRFDNGGKGESEVNRIWEAWLAWRMAFLTVPNVAATYEEYTLYMEGLNKKMTEPNGKKQVQAKLVDQAMTRSFLRVNAIDKEEDLKRIGPPLAGLADMLDRGERFLVAQSGWPYQILLGKLPGGGLGGTGESEGSEQDYHKFIARQQRKYLKPLITRFFSLIGGPDEFEFPPMHQHTEKEWADIQLVQAQRDNVYAQIPGALGVEELRENLSKNGVYNLDLTRSPEPEIEPKYDDI